MLLPLYHFQFVHPIIIASDFVFLLYISLLLYQRKSI